MSEHISTRVRYAEAAAELVEWLRTFPTDSEAITLLAASMADGMTIPAFCKEHKIRWSMLSAWIREDAERDRRYRAALADRQALWKESLMDKWWRTAEAEPGAEHEHVDVQRARQSIAKAIGIDQSGDATPVAGGSPIQINVQFVTPERAA